MRITKLITLLTALATVAAFVGRIKPHYGFYSG